MSGIKATCGGRSIIAYHRQESYRESSSTDSGTAPYRDDKNDKSCEGHDTHDGHVIGEEEASLA